jgi:hypothetical protein
MPLAEVPMHATYEPGCGRIRVEHVTADGCAREV